METRLIVAQAQETDQPATGAPAADEAGQAPATGEQEGLIAEVEAEADGHAEAYGEESWLSAELLLVFALVALFLIVLRPARRAIVSGLDNRAATIRGDLEEAQRLREEAQAALASFQRKQRDALAEAEEIVSHARTEAERMRDRALADLEESFKRRESQAEDRIQQAQQAAAAEVRKIAVDVAVSATRRLIAEQLQQDPARAASLVDSAIEDLPKRLH